MTLEALLPFLTGPGSSVIILSVIIYGIWKFVTEHVIPRVDKQLSENRNSLRELISQHDQDRKVWLSSIDNISGRMAELHGGLIQMSNAVSEITEAVKDIEEELKESRLTRPHPVRRSGKEKTDEA